MKESRPNPQFWHDPELQVLLDLRCMGMSAAALESLGPGLRRALTAMAKLEKGAIANPDENRMVGHYWLRDPDRAPQAGLRQAIRETVSEVISFADDVHWGVVKPPSAPRFTDFLLIGIGGSALGPQFVSRALGEEGHPMRAHFIDNTDPEGIDRVLGEIGRDLRRTLVLVISKSGGTKETRNGMLEVEAAYEASGLEFGPHAVAVTGENSALEKTALEKGFLRVFPMWDWVGGRTSELSAVGLLPAALEGFDIRALLDGARAMDKRTRVRDPEKNPAALLAAAWHHAGDGLGTRDMVVLPYKDRLELASRYLQQLVMESLGKEKNRKGEVVHQGLAVYGNKGSTDQHAYVQQLRDGPDDFFVTFIQVLRDRVRRSPEMEDGATAGDFLIGFLLGTREALAERGRRSMTLVLPEVTASAVGMLIALFERAVGLYAELIDVNAYHQPGVEAGKKAAARVLDLQSRALTWLRRQKGREKSLGEISKGTKSTDIDTLFYILEHAAANPEHEVEVIRGEAPMENRYRTKLK